MWKVQLAEIYGKSEKTHKIMKYGDFIQRIYLFTSTIINFEMPLSDGDVPLLEFQMVPSLLQQSIIFYFWKKYYANCFSGPQHLKRYLECINDIIGKIAGNSYFKNQRYLFYWVSRFRWFNVLFQIGLYI